MKKNLMWALLAFLLVALIVGATGLYNSLKDKVELNNMVVEATAVPAPTAEPAPQATEAPQATATPTPRPRAAAPDFTVLDSNGSEVKLSSFVGKPVVVNFWASWCGPCKSEMPEFQEAWEKYGDQVVFMLVNMTDGSRETIDTAKAYVEKKGFTFPVYFDTMMEAAMAYGVSSIPATYFIAADGSLTARVSGAISLSTLERGLEMIME